MSMDNKTTAQHHGVVFTRVPVVEFMLDLVGYHPDEQLHTLRLLEPSFGDGRFVIQAAGRLLQSWRAAGGQDPHDLIDAIRAVEIDPQSVAQFSQRLVDYLVTQRIALMRHKSLRRRGSCLGTTSPPSSITHSTLWWAIHPMCDTKRYPKTCSKNTGRVTAPWWPGRPVHSLRGKIT